MELENCSLKSELSQILEENVGLRKQIDEYNTQYNHLQDEHSHALDRVSQIETMELEINQLTDNQAKLGEIQVSFEQQNQKLQHFDQIQSEKSHLESELSTLREIKSSLTTAEKELEFQKSMNKTFVSMLDQQFDAGETKDQMLEVNKYLKNEVRGLGQDKKEMGKKLHMLEFLNKQMSEKLGIELGQNGEVLGDSDV